MTGERMGRLRTIVEDALEQPAGERAEFVAIACADDTELKRTAEQLLDAESNFGSFLDLPETARVRAAHSEILGPDSVGGRRIGPYQLVQVLARGGMGTVFCAVRADDAFEQQVAIKLINRGMDSEALLRRFEQERQFLADLDHPNIARLLDGGTSEDGQPYIVMEYIEGEPIDAFCDSQRLGVRKRIELFRQVCLAVQYAHQNLVVHRDIKPANILVTSSGIPKLLDFGISKLLANDAPGSGQGEWTLTGLQAMTPRYASPEQITAGRITTASDVYSLGVVLYELLSGHRPYLLDDLTGYEKERVICETEPTRPSTAVTTSRTLRSASGRVRLVTPESVAETRRERPDQLRRALRGDLDNIILRAMAKDSQRRYATAEQLSEDLQRHLDGRPVNARTPSMAYRAVKFVKRNKTSVTAAAIVVLALLCGLIVSRTAYVQMREAEQHALGERYAAIKSQSHAQNVNAFLQEVLASANPYRTGRVASILDLLRDAESRIGRELQNQPEIEADVRYAIANAYAGLWRWEQAADHLKKAVKLNRDHRRRDHPAMADCLPLLGRSLAYLGDPACIAVQHRALALQEQLDGDKSLRVAQTIGLLGLAYHRCDRTVSGKVAADNAFRQSLAMFTRIDNGPSHGEAMNSYCFAEFLREQSRYEEAEPYYRQALVLFRSLPHQQDRYMAECLNGYSELLTATRRHQEAVAFVQEYLAMTPEGFKDLRVNSATWRLARLYHLHGYSDYADQTYNRALQLELEWLGEREGERAERASRLLPTLVDRSGKWTARPPYGEIFQLLYEEYEQQPWVARNFVALSGLLCERGACESAATLLRDCLLDMDHHMAHDWRVDRVRSMLRECLRHQAGRRLANPLLIGGYEVLAGALGANHPVTGTARSVLLWLYGDWGHSPPAAQG